MSVELLRESDVQSQVRASIDLVGNSTSIEMTAFLKFVHLIYRSSGLTSALGTNAVVRLFGNTPVFYEIYYPFLHNGSGVGCYKEADATGQAFFIAEASDYYEEMDKDWDPDYDHYRDQNTDSNNSATMKGFSGGCFPLDALLASTLECLYDSQCLSILPDYFPGFDQVCLEFLLSILTVLRF